jgi:hypothetical protein
MTSRRPEAGRASRLVVLVLAAQLLVATSAVAAGLGSIEGRVVDAQIRAPLPRADVVIASTGRGAYTDLDGRYRIVDLEPGTYSLTFSYVSYETAVATDVVVKPGAPVIVDQELFFSAIEGATIEVRPSFFPDDPGTPVSTVTLSREEIRRFPGGLEDVVRTVATLPGVALLNSGGRNDLLVRGGGPSENLYLIEGIEVPNINHFGNQGTAGGALSFVNLDFVDAVDFSTGGFGAKYGDRMSSSMAIELRGGRSDRLGGKATLSATQFGLNLEGPVAGSGSFLFSARQSYLDLLFRALGQPFIPIYTDLNAFAEVDLSPRYQLSIIGLAALDRIERDLSTEENRVKNAALLDNSQNRWIGGARLRRLVDRGYVDVSLGVNRTDFALAQGDTSQTVYYRSDAVETETALRASTFLRFANLFDLDTGLQLKNADVENRTAFADSVYDRSGNRVPREELDLPARIDLDASGVKLGGWGELHRRFGGALDVSAGLRVDVYEYLDTPTYLAPRFSARFRATERLQLGGSFGTYYQSPSYVWIANPVNDGLRALRNDMAVVGFDYLLRDDLNFSAELYAKRYRDLPAGATEGTSHLVLTNTGIGFGGNEDDFQSFGYFPLESTGTGNARGIDLLLQKKFSDTPWYGSAGLTLGRSRFTAPNGQTYPGQYDQPVIVSLNAGYVINSKWQLGAKWRYASGAPYTPVYDPALNDGQIQNLPDEYLSARLDAFHALDVRVDRRFSFGSWSMIAFVDIQNIYDHRAQEVPRWDFWNQEIVDRDELGFFPTIGLSGEF